MRPTRFGSSGDDALTYASAGSEHAEHVDIWSTVLVLPLVLATATPTVSTGNGGPPDRFDGPGGVRAQDARTGHDISCSNPVWRVFATVRWACPLLAVLRLPLDPFVSGGRPPIVRRAKRRARTTIGGLSRLSVGGARLRPNGAPARPFVTDGRTEIGKGTIYRAHVRSCASAFRRALIARAKRGDCRPSYLSGRPAGCRQKSGRACPSGPGPVNRNRARYIVPHPGLARFGQCLAAVPVHDVRHRVWQA